VIVGVPLQIQVLNEWIYLSEVLGLAMSSDNTAEVVNIRAVARERGKCGGREKVR
jgi:hypothetical protein